MPDSIIKAFEKKYGVKVVYDDFASNEDMFAKLMAVQKATTWLSRRQTMFLS